MKRKKRYRKKRPRKSKTRQSARIVGLMARIALGLVLFSVLWVGMYRWVNPPGTLLMLQRSWGKEANKETPDRKWLPYDALSENLKRAAITAEDAHFMQHVGFDKEAIKEAYRRNKTGDALRGGSTISQQTAKNVFLWPQRSWVRKGLEAWFTMLIEALWGKKRILEVYLNVIEMGNGVYGAEAACQYYYGKSAQALTKRQAALLVAILPDPRRWSPSQPTAFINRKTRNILRYMPYSQIP